jgi:hypothetical protein
MRLSTFIIGGGINDCGIAREAAGRDLSVELAKMTDCSSNVVCVDRIASAWFVLSLILVQI